MSLLKTTFKSLYDNNFPDYLRLELHSVSSYNLRSSVAPVIGIPIRETDTFQDCTSSLFNTLPTNVQQIFDYQMFCKAVRYLLLFIFRLILPCKHDHFVK